MPLSILDRLWGKASPPNDNGEEAHIHDIQTGDPSASADEVKPAKPKWQRELDVHLRAGRLPPNDVMSSILDAYIAEKRAPLYAAFDDMQAKYTRMTLRYLDHRTKLKSVFDNLPTTPFETPDDRDDWRGGAR